MNPKNCANTIKRTHISKLKFKKKIFYYRILYKLSHNLCLNSHTRPLKVYTFSTQYQFSIYKNILSVYRKSLQNFQDCKIHRGETKHRLC